LAATPLPQRIAKDLDELVQAHRAGDEITGGADELRQTWSEYAGSALVLGGGQAIIGKDVALRASQSVGQWLMPASVAGLRQLRPAGSLELDEVLALVGQLAALSDDADSVAAFRDWLWADGCAGFAVDLQPSLLFRSEMLSPAEGARHAVDRGRVEDVNRRAVGFARRRQAGQDVLAAEADRRLSSYFQALGQGSLTLTPDVGAQLRVACEDGAFWTQRLAESIAPDERLRAFAAPALAARVVLDAWQGGPTLDARSSLAALDALFPEEEAAEPAEAPAEGDEAAPTDESAAARKWIEALRRSVSDEALGRAVGAGVALDDATVARLGIMMRDIAVPFSVGVATGVLERAGGGEAAVKQVAAALNQIGLQQLWSRAALSELSEPVARGIAHVLKVCDAGADLYADLVVACPANVAAWILRNAPAHVRSRIETRLHQLFRTRDPTENTPLVQTLISTGSATSMRALGDVLLQTKGKGWAGQIVPELCAAIVKHRLGGEYLVPLFRDREADTKFRLLVLRSLESDAELVADAVKFRVGEFVEPKEIQARMKAVRKRLKG